MDFENVEYIKNYDGDTITVNISNVHPLLGHAVPVRVRGVDTEEMKSHTELSYKSKMYVERIMRGATTITLRNCERCKYFRIVADVLVDGRSLAELLIKNGYSKSMKYPK